MLFLIRMELRGNWEKGNIAANKVLRKGVPPQVGLDEDADFYEEVPSDHQQTLG